MVRKNGSILSPAGTLLNEEADKNFIFFKNIFFRPQNNESKLYFINLSKKEVIKEVLIRENYLNEIEVEKKLFLRIYTYLRKNVLVFLFCVY